MELGFRHVLRVVFRRRGHREGEEGVAPGASRVHRRRGSDSTATGLDKVTRQLQYCSRTTLDSTFSSQVMVSRRVVTGISVSPGILMPRNEYRS